MLDWDDITNDYNIVDKNYIVRRGEPNEVYVVVLCGNAVPFKPGFISGPPERCYPPEGGYTEDIIAFDIDTMDVVELTSDEEWDAGKNLYQLYCQKTKDEYEPPSNL